MSVTMICPNLKCGRTVIAPDSARGKVVRCVHCHSAFIVPQRQGDGPAEPLPTGKANQKAGKS